MTYNISTLVLADKEQWQSLYRGYAAFYQVPMNEKILETVWSWIFDDSKEFYALLAKDSAGNALGLMHFRAMLSPLRGSSVGFLDDLFISPQGRGAGLVEEMFSALKTQGEQHHWPFVRWITAEDNYRARSVYDKVATKTPWQTYQLNCD